MIKTIKSGIFPQQNFNYKISINDVYKYKSGAFIFLANNSGGDSGVSQIFFIDNGIFDKNKNFIFSLKPLYENYLSGNFNSGHFNCYYSDNSDFDKKVLIYQSVDNFPSISGLLFSADVKDIYEQNSYPAQLPNIEVDPLNFPIYNITHSGGEFSDSNLYFNFQFENKNIGPIEIKNIEFTQLFSPQNSYEISNLTYPINVYPGDSLVFSGNNLFEDIDVNKYINLNFETNAGNLLYSFNLISTPSVFGEINLPRVEISSNINFDINGNRLSHWFFQLYNISGLSNIYFELSGLNSNYYNKLYRNILSARVFGYEPAAYTSTNFSDSWFASVKDENLTGNSNIKTEEYGNIQNLKNFSWTDKWDDAIFLNKENNAIHLFKIEKTGFSINDINLFLYSKTNSSGLLNCSLYKISITGKADGYKNILSGMGWETGNLINGFPSGFPSGFPFSGQDIYGFFSGFGFGKLSGYTFTGEPLQINNKNIDSFKLAPSDSNYYAPISEEKKITLNIGLGNLDTGFYALKFSAVPDTGVLNESGLFWPKMWPNLTESPLDQPVIVYDSGKYFYQSGFEMSGNAYSGISGISFVQNLISKDSGFYYTGIKYNGGIGFNQTNNLSDVIGLNFNNYNSNFGTNNNYLRFNFGKYMNSGIGYENLFLGSGKYKISGVNLLKTGIIGVTENIFRQIEAFYTL